MHDLNHLEIRTACVLGALYAMLLLLMAAHSRARRNDADAEAGIAIVIIGGCAAQCWIVSPMIYGLTGFWLHDMAWINGILTAITGVVYFSFALAND